MRECVIHGDRIESLQQLHRQLKEDLQFPDWYGGNLDALYDCLTELPEATLTIYHWSALAETVGEKAEALRQVLTDAGMESRWLTVCILDEDDHDEI